MRKTENFRTLFPHLSALLGLKDLKKSNRRERLTLSVSYVSAVCGPTWARTRDPQIMSLML
jgi:hypothetical protein